MVKVMVVNLVLLTDHEAQIYGATYMQQAYLMKDQFTKEQFKIVDEYIDTLWKKYVEPWATDAHKLNRHTRSFIQMADGTISALSYLAWKDKPEEAEKWIKSGIAKADRVVYKDGYIPNNSFRGVRDVWYQSQGVNNLLGLYAIAELWGYKQFPKELKQRIDKTVDILNLGLQTLKLTENVKITVNGKLIQKIKPMPHITYTKWLYH